MVTPKGTRKAILVALLALLALTAWLLMPSMIFTGAEPYPRKVRSALGAYREIHGRFPAKLLEIKPFLDASAGIESTITEVDANRYSVVIIWQRSEAHVLEVSYKVAVDGTLEDYDVRSMDDSDR